MKRNLLYAATLLAAVSVLITPIAALADKGVISEIGPEIGAVEITVDTRPHRLADNTVTEATGKTWIDADTGERLFEYTARIDSAPEYIGDTRIDCTWHQEAPGQWEAGANLFTATVTNRLTKVKYDDNNLIWSPQVFVGGVEYTCDKEPELLPVDPINENYRNNTLSWDYGVCERRLRLIEGMISEVYIFERDPGADVQIKTNGVKDRGFEGETPVFAYDAAGNSIPISADKVVKAADLKGAAYPVTIDPTEVFVTSASDSRCYLSNSNYNTARTTASGTVGSDLRIGQLYSSGTYVVNRAFVYFDTSALPDGATISSAILSLRGETDVSTTNFNIVVQTGMPTYPHDPLATGDYKYDLYSGTGSSFSTGGYVTTGYNNISLTADGLTWINKAGITKFCIRSSRDIAATTPTYPEYVQVYNYEKGAGYRPTLYVTYVSSGPPDVSSVAATYVTKTTARVNGYLDSDGGEATTVSFIYHPWYNTSWSYCLELTLPAPIVGQKAVMITNDSVNAEFWANVNTSGLDIVVCDEDFVTPLNREIITINTTTSDLEMYANVSDGTERLYLYFGNPTANISDDFATYEDYHETYSARVAASTDNCRVYYTGSAWALDTSSIYVGYASATVLKLGSGMRFLALNLTKDSHICNANILFTSRANLASDSIKTYFTGELTGTPATFSSIANYQGRRGVAAGGSDDTQRTVTQIAWEFTTDWATDSTYQSPELKTIVQEQVDANTLIDLCMFFDDHDARGTQSSNVARSGYAYSDSAAKAPLLTVDYIPKLNISITETYTPTATQSKNTGDSFYSSLTGLTANTLYGFRAMGEQTQGTDYGAWLTFTTSATSDGPLSLYAYPDATYIDLSWLKGVGAVNTLVRYNVGSYPSSTADGNLVYSGPASAYTHTGLTSGTTYYYRSWSDDGLGVYSANYSSVMCTTLAGSAEAGATPEAPDMPSNWFGSPDYTNMDDAPLYDMWNAVADSMEMPRNSFWMLLTILNIILISFIFFFISKGNLIVAVGASAVCMAAAGAIELISFWYVGIYLIAAIALSYRAVTR